MGAIQLAVLRWAQRAAHALCHASPDGHTCLRCGGSAGATQCRCSSTPGPCGDFAQRCVCSTTHAHADTHDSSMPHAKPHSSVTPLAPLSAHSDHAQTCVELSWIASSLRVAAPVLRSRAASEAPGNGTGAHGGSSQAHAVAAAAAQHTLCWAGADRLAVKRAAVMLQLDSAERPAGASAARGGSALLPAVGVSVHARQSMDGMVYAWDAVLAPSPGAPSRPACNARHAAGRPVRCDAWNRHCMQCSSWPVPSISARTRMQPHCRSCAWLPKTLRRIQCATCAH